jgi:hypothetical protein
VGARRYRAKALGPSSTRARVGGPAACAVAPAERRVRPARRAPRPSGLTWEGPSAAQRTNLGRAQRT